MTLAALSALAGIALLLAACGGGSDGDGGDLAEVCRLGIDRAAAHARADATGASTGRCWAGRQAFGPGYVAIVEIHGAEISWTHHDLVPIPSARGAARCRVRVDLVLGEVEMLDCYRPQS